MDRDASQVMHVNNMLYDLEKLVSIKKMNLVLPATSEIN